MKCKRSRSELAAHTIAWPFTRDSSNFAKPLVWPLIAAAARVKAAPASLPESATCLRCMRAWEQQAEAVMPTPERRLAVRMRGLLCVRHVRTRSAVKRAHALPLELLFVEQDTSTRLNASTIIANAWQRSADAWQRSADA